MRKTILSALLLAPALALANGYDVPNVATRDLATVSAGVAAQEGASATNTNPAALSRTEGLNLSLSASGLWLNTNWKPPPGSSQFGTPPPGQQSTDFNLAPPVALFASYGGKLEALGGRGAGVGLGFGVPFGGNVFWPDEWAGRGRIITVERRVYGTYLTAGIEAIPGILRVGGGPIYYYVTQYLKQGVEPTPGAYGELAVTGGHFSYELAAEVTPLPDVPLTIGIDYKHKANVTQTGDGNFVVPPGLNTTATQDQGVSTQLTMPNLLNVGVAYRVAKPVLLMFGYTFCRYVEYKEDRFVGSAGLELEVPRFYGNGHDFRLAAEWDVNNRWTVRGGILRDISGMDIDHWSPTLPDSNAWAFAGGAAYRVNPDLTVSASIYFALLDSVTTTNNRTATNPGGTFPGVFDSSALIGALGVAWHAPY
jgi:long-chain fatty acid transport protein